MAIKGVRVVLVVTLVLLAPPCSLCKPPALDRLGPPAQGSADGRLTQSPPELLAARSKVQQDFLAGHIDDAMAETQKAISLAQAAHGKYHPDVAFLKAVLSSFRESRGDFAAARDLLGEALEILERDTMRTSELASQVRINLAQVEQFAEKDEQRAAA